VKIAYVAVDTQYDMIYC